MFRRLAGVLLGKTSFNSLYGLMGELPANCATVLAMLIRPVSRLAYRRMNKIVVFLGFTPAAGDPPAWPRGRF
jgi:hypothetical protein